MARAETISAAMVLRLVKLLEARGVDFEPLLTRAGLSAAMLRAEQGRVAYTEADTLLESAAETLGAANLGLELALTRSDESYGAAGLLLVTGSTFRQGLSRSLAYQRLWADGERFTLSGNAEHCAVRFRHPGPARLASAITAECALVEVLEGVRALVDRDAVPLSVELVHAPLAEISPLGDHLGVEPRFSQPENRIVLAAELVDRPMHAARDVLAAALERQAVRALSLLPARDALAARARALLVDEQGLKLSLAEAAAALRMSPRTLQRRLMQERTSFDQLVDDARRDQAQDLQRRGTPAKEVAFRLGFRDPSALSRARRRWSRG